MPERQKQSAPDLEASLAQQLSIPLLGARLLRKHGIKGAREGHAFLYPNLASLPSPWLMKGMNQGVELVLKAQAQEMPIIVFGDYDVDGVCATIILVTFLQEMGLEPGWYVPDRLTQGYGLTTSAVDEICAKTNPPALIITVDNGITAISEIKRLKQKGFSVLLTDHHKPKQKIPKADAVINPHQPGCEFPFADLAGAGVAFFLIMALRSALVQNKTWSKKTAPNLKDYLDLVALGTVADSMPLQDVNRVLTRAGLETLSLQKRPGLRALCGLAGTSEPGSFVRTEDISFYLAPRINAAGRMGNAIAAIKLLLARDMASSMQAAAHLEQINTRRKRIQEEVIKEALEKCEKIHEQHRSIMVLFHKHWHIGVLGIVAARICDHYQVPALVLTRDPNKDGMIMGSGRGADGRNLFEEISRCSDLLTGFGGHSQAIGLKLPEANLHPLIERLNNGSGMLHKQNKEGKQEHGIIEIREIDEVISEDFLVFLRAMEPFGQGNPEPVFLYKGARPHRPTLIKKRHVRFSLKSTAGKHCDVIAFNLGHRFSLLKDPVAISFRVRKNTYQGRERVQLVAVNISPSS